MNKINAQNIYKSFQGLEVLKGINLSVDEGEVVAVIGPSGGGKRSCCGYRPQRRRQKYFSALPEQAGNYRQRQNCYRRRNACRNKTGRAGCICAGRRKPPYCLQNGYGVSAV